MWCASSQEIGRLLEHNVENYCTYPMERMDYIVNGMGENKLTDLKLE